MADVKLILQADNSQHIAKMKEAQKETQKVYDIADKGIKKEITILQTLENSLNNVKARRTAAFDEKEIDKWDKKIIQAEKDLEQFRKTNEKTGDTAEKANTKVKASGDSLMQSISKWALNFGVITAVVGALKEAFMKLTVSINAVNIAGAVYKQVMYNIITAQSNWLQGVMEAIRIQDQFNKIRYEGYREGVEIQKLETIYQQKYSAAISEVTDSKKKLILIDEALAAHNKAIDIQQREQITLRDTYQAQILNQKGDEGSIKGYYAALQEIDRLDAERESSTRRLVLQKANILKDDHDNALKRWHDEIEAQNKVDEEAVKSQKDALDEKEKLIKQFFDDWERETKIDIQKRDDLMNSETGMGKSWDDWFNQAMKEAETDNSNREKRLKKASDEVDEFFKIWEREADIDNKKHEENDKVLKDMKAESLKQMGTAVLDYIKIVDELAQKEVDRTQRERELLDTRVSEAQDALNTEVELYKAGYASNVNAKKKELADLKVARDKALKDEELARKKQHTIELASLVAQKAVDIAKIISSAAVANIKAKALSPATFGQPWAAINNASAALQIAAIIAAVIAASTAKYAKGGYTGDGRGFRDETGEEVAGTVHKREFVVRRGPASKFRDVLEAINRDDRKMILHSINKLSPELLGGTTNVFVENEGPNNRLDQLITENKKLNAKLSGESIQNFGNVQVIRKGNSIRTIR